MSKLNSTTFFLLVGDIFVTQIALFLALLIRNNGLLNQFESFSYHFFPLYVAWILVLFLLNLYDVRFFKKPLDFFLHVIIFSFVALFASITYFYFRSDLGIAPKTILLLNVITFVGLFVLWRYLFHSLFHIKTLKEKVVLVGLPKNAKDAVLELEKNYDVVALLPVGNYFASGVLSENIAVASSVQDFEKIITEKKVTSVIFALDFQSHQSLIPTIFSHLPLTLNYLDFNDVYEFIHKKISLEYINEIWFLEKISKPENRFEKIVKRFIDIAVSLVGITCFLILFPVLALCIQLDSRGNIFYSQKRVGKNGKVFIIHKFRSMQENDAQDKEIWREKNVNTITRVGRVLRRMHLDELPQSWSLFKGDVSFVGPRPEFIELAKIFEKEIPFYRQRYIVKPGIIGWAQINFPASHTIDQVKEKFRYDLYYIKNHSLLLDLEIILKAIKLFLW